MIDRGGINSIIRLIHTIVNEKLFHYSRGSGGTGAPPIPPEIMKNHPLDPDDGPHTGALTEADVTLDDAAGHDHQGAADTGKKVDHANVDNVTTDQHHPKIHAPAHKSGGEQPLDVKELVDSEGRLLTGVQKTDLTDGGLTTLHQHAGIALAKHIHAYKEDKSAECDGVKVTFITAQQFEPYTLRVFHERLEQVNGMVDYAEGAMYDHFDMVAAPNPGDKLVVHYLAQRS